MTTGGYGPKIVVRLADLEGTRPVDRVAELMGRVYAEGNAADWAEVDRKLVHGDGSPGADESRYESHQWGGGDTGEECVACDVHWQDCEGPCSARTGQPR